jgi:hypothetical protein
MSLTPRQMILANIIWDYHKLDNYNGLVDVIIGLGSYSMLVAKHAADLYHKGIAPYIFLLVIGDIGQINYSHQLKLK